MSRSATAPRSLRFGGEEFGVILPAADRETARIVAERIRTSIMGRELVKRSTVEALRKVTISIGVAEQRSNDSAVTLLERADSCLFAAKRAGRNRTVDHAQSPALSYVA